MLLGWMKPPQRRGWLARARWLARAPQPATPPHRSRRSSYAARAWMQHACPPRSAAAARSWGTTAACRPCACPGARPLDTGRAAALRWRPLQQRRFQAGQLPPPPHAAASARQAAPPRWLWASLAGYPPPPPPLSHPPHPHQGDAPPNRQTLLSPLSGAALSPFSEAAPLALLPIVLLLLLHSCAQRLCRAARPPPAAAGVPGLRQRWIALGPPLAALAHPGAAQPDQ